MERPRLLIVGGGCNRLLDLLGPVDAHVHAVPAEPWSEAVVAAADADLLILEVPVDSTAPGRYLVSDLTRTRAQPVLVVLERSAPEVRESVLEAGAAEVAEAPFSPRELRLRVDRLLEAARSRRRLETSNRALAQALSERTTELEEARVQILERLARAAEYRDDETGEHTRRVGALSGALAEGLGVPADEVQRISRAAALHDVGKIGVPDGILLKPGRLTPKEIEVMQAHTTIGAQMLSGTNIPLLNMAATIALTHHEHWNGNGYPEGTRGRDIPLVGRIVAVADVFDALTTRRPYKQAWSLEETVAELEAHRERQFDPDVVDVVLSLVLRDALPEPIRQHVASTNPWSA